mgnify:CR=1 FL=1
MKFNRHNLMTGIALVAVSLSTVVISAARSPAPQSNWPPAGSEFHSIQTFDLMEHIGRYYVVGRVDASARLGTVHLAYSANRTGPREHPLATASLRVEADGFTPTVAAVVDPTHVAVAGHRSDGVTVVELWSVTEPTVSSSVDASGSRTYSLSTPTVSAKQPLLTVNTAGRRGVRRLVKVRGKPASLLVQFHDSRDLYELDYSVSPSALTLLYAARPGASAQVLADLLHDDLRSTFAARHSQLGCLYIFAPTLATTDENAHASPEVALVDEDCDGDIDSILHPTREERVAWADAGYVEWGLATRW